MTRLLPSLLAMFTAVAASQPAAAAPAESFCAVLSVGASRFVVDSQLDVVGLTARPGPFSYESPSGVPIAAIECRRASPLPLPNDRKVVDAGIPLYMQTQHSITVLARDASGYELRLVRGRLTPQEQASFDAARERWRSTPVR
jgi:hypothetical protein